MWKRIQTLTIKVDGCWIYVGTCQSAGYGHIYLGGPGYKKKLLHRLSWERYYGPIPDGMCVLHRCDRPACWRPKHLFLGTKGDNNRDCVAKGRNARGEKARNSKLKASEVLEIRALMAAGHRVIDVARMYNISPPQICGIRDRQFWKHI